MNYTNMAEHVNVLMLIVIGLANVVGFLLWRTMSRMEEKLDEFMKSCHETHMRITGEFLSRAEFEKYREELRIDRETRWSKLTDKLEDILTRFWTHEHNSHGEVKRS